MAGHTEDRSASEAGIGNLLGGDGFRGIGMTMVFVAHIFANADPAATLASYGWAKQPIARIDLMLSTFFVLSGYLISRGFMRSFVLGTRRPSVRRYARNRVLRIVPIFYLIAAIVLLRFGLDGAIGPTPDNPSGTGEPSKWWQLLSVFTFTQSYTGGSATLPIGQAWSLDVEMAFYAAIPIAAVIAYRLGTPLKTPRARAVAALSFIGFLTLFSIALRQYANNHFELLTSPPLIVYVFLPGVALAVIEPFAVPWLRGHERRARRLVWGAVAVAVLAYLLYIKWDYEAGTTQIHHALGRRSLLQAIFGTCLIGAMMALQLGTGGAPRWLNNRWTNWLGVRSYAFYLLHVWVFFEIIHVVGAETDPVLLGLILIVVGFPISVTLAGLSWRYVERPCLERRLPWAPGLRPQKEKAHEVLDPKAEPAPAKAPV
ncbi:MAG TPA: acyltransferase [Solirubrobacteraceae bacterium]|nr:acyltransferase [Solirubrobacteraceae bacterium]